MELKKIFKKFFNQEEKDHHEQGVMEKEFLIYILDDDTEFAYFLKTSLEKLLDAYVKVFFHPHNALRTLEKESKLPDLFFCDYKMPEMSGLQVQRTIKEDWSLEIPFIFITALQGEDISDEDLIVLSKPLNFIKLRQQIERFIPLESSTSKDS